MTRVGQIPAGICLIAAEAALCLLGSATLGGAQQEGSNGLQSLRMSLTQPVKPTWHGGPASTPLQAEAVPPPPAVRPPAKSLILGPQKQRNKAATTVGSPPAGSVSPASSTSRTSNALARPVSAPTPAAAPPLGALERSAGSGAQGAKPRDYTDSPDPEALRIRDELERLRRDSEARRTFYDDLRRTVERVRAGMPDEDSLERGTGSQPRPGGTVPITAESSRGDQHSAQTGYHDVSLTDQGQALRTGAQAQDSLEQKSSPPASPSSHDTSSEPSGSPKPQESRPASAGAPQASLGTRGGSIDRAAYLRVVRWARANGTPVPLALGVAWVESQLHTDPPRGAAGEVGMFQIMPARCQIEGWPPKRLKEPDFNAWLGTRLLARYYQEEGSWPRAAAKYVAGPGVFNKTYPADLWNYINWYASAVNSYASYFSLYQT